MGPARLLRLCPLALLWLAWCGGCQRGPAVLAPVSGKIAYRGAYLNGGLVVFTPDTSRGGSGPVVFGKIRSDGSYTISTGDKEGASAGWYRVSVAALLPALAGTPPVSLVPEKYRDPQQSQLGCEVKAERTNQLDFNLD